MNSDANANQQDTVQQTGQPSAGQGQPSTPPKTYKQDEVDKLISERHSTLDKKIAELDKAHKAEVKTRESAESRARIAAERLAEMEEEHQRRELDGIRDNPDALSLWQARQAHREAVREFEAKQEAFEKDRSQFTADLEEVKSYKTLRLATDIASKPEYSGVKAETLVNLTDGTPDKMEQLAKLLKASMGQSPTTVTMVQPPDSGRQTGGAGEPSMEELEAMTPEQYAEYYNRRTSKKK